jgi:hypothetical protein
LATLQQSPNDGRNDHSVGQDKENLFKSAMPPAAVFNGGDKSSVDSIFSSTHPKAQSMASSIEEIGKGWCVSKFDELSSGPRPLAILPLNAHCAVVIKDGFLDNCMYFLKSGTLCDLSFEFRIVSACFILLAACSQFAHAQGFVGRDELTPEMIEVLKHPNAMFVYSLKAEETKVNPNYFGWKMLGKAAVTGQPDRENIGQMLIAETSPKSVAYCPFQPHHGVSIFSKGSRLDYVIASIVAKFKSIQVMVSTGIMGDLTVRYPN